NSTIDSQVGKVVSTSTLDSRRHTTSPGRSKASVARQNRWRTTITTTVQAGILVTVRRSTRTCISSAGIGSGYVTTARDTGTAARGYRGMHGYRQSWLVVVDGKDLRPRRPQSGFQRGRVRGSPSAAGREGARHRQRRRPRHAAGRRGRRSRQRPRGGSNGIARRHGRKARRRIDGGDGRR